MTLNPRWSNGHQLLQEVVAEALADPQYREELVSNPKKVLKRKGLTGLENVNVTVHENTSTEVHLVLPPAPEPGDELPLNELDITVLIEITGSV
jgi:hypothetical protein